MIATAITIRPYRSADLDALIALFHGAVRMVARRDYTAAQVAAWAPDEIDRARWAEALPQRGTVVAEIAGQVAGFSDLEADGHIHMLFVHTAHQGRGVARALLAHVEGTARERGLDRLHTEASITARPVFARMGFTVIAAQEVERRGQVLRNFRMEKRLAPA